MRYKDFKSALEFLQDYGFEYSYDSATGRRRCYKNCFGEIVLDYMRLDPNYYVPQICTEINCWKQVVDVEKKYSELKGKRGTLYRLIRRVTMFDMLHEVVKSEVNNGKVFGILIETKYLI